MITVLLVAVVVLLTVYCLNPATPQRFSQENVRCQCCRLPEAVMVRTVNHSLINDLKKCNEILKDVKIKPFAEPRKVYNPVCKMDFLGYKSSKLERYMIDHVKEFQGMKGESFNKSSEKYCNFMRSDYVKSALNEFLYTMAQYKNVASFEHIKVNTDIFSTMTYRTTCQDGATEVNTHYIEPLLGLTRHPNAICLSKPWLKNLDYILLQSFQDNLFYQRMNKSDQIQYIGMDLGASTWGSSGVTNTNWFFAQYEKRGAKFDRMLMWETIEHKRDKIYNFPPKYTSSFQYFNILADLDPNAEGNPLRVLHKIARKEDFIMLKLDIDTAREVFIVLALLENPNAMANVDEFFFEHHTVTPIMHSYWKTNVACDLFDTYKIFLQLRHSGVRTHGWP